MSEFPKNPQIGQTVSYSSFLYQWDGKKWLVVSPPDPLSVPVYVSEDAPMAPLPAGTLWFKASKNTVSMWSPLPTGLQWLQVEDSPESLGSLTVSKNPPTEPQSGNLWYNPVSKTTSSWATYIDPPSWVTLIQDINSSSPVSSAVVVSEEQPSDRVTGLFWYKASSNSLSIQVEGINGISWQTVSSTETYGQPPVHVSESAPAKPRNGDLWWNPAVSELSVWVSAALPPYWQTINSPFNSDQGSITFNDSGTGAPPGTSFDGSTSEVVSYNTFGAAAHDQTVFIGTTPIPLNRTTGPLTLSGVSIEGNAETVTQGVYTSGNQAIAGSKTFTDLITCVRSGVLIDFDRIESDGDLARFQRDSATQGAISVAVGTVTYGAFLGSHWSKLSDETSPEIPIGTVLEAISEEVIWKVAKFSYTDNSGETFFKRVAYNGPAKVGEAVEFEYGSFLYGAIIEEEEAGQKGFNKHVKVKVSDTFGSSSVYGVFVGYDKNAGNKGIEGYWNDIVVGSVGNFVVRIAPTETVNNGDLLTSNGDGSAVVQSDDIVRSRTIGKVTSTKVQRVYEDGSYLIPCVLYCG